MAHLGRVALLAWTGLVLIAGCDEATSPAPEFSAKVVGISDGDTITVLRDRARVRVRLDGIDCPERGQAFGKSAKTFTADLAFGKPVSIRPRNIDRYGRTVAEVLLPDGRNLSQELVRSGFAWWYRKYAAHDEQLARLEAEAESAKKGLWADPHPVPPWEWRKQHATATGSRTATSLWSRAATSIMHQVARQAPRCLLIIGLFLILRKRLRKRTTCQ